MGLPARKMESVREPAKRAGSRAAVSAARSPSARKARASDLVTRAAVLAIVLLALSGVARVAMAVKAAEAAIDAHRLERSIRSELLEGRELEADCSALAAPSRIGAIASSTLNMRATAAPRYICIPSDPASDGDRAAGGADEPRPEGPAAEGRGVLARLLEDLVAGEAQALLVGDVGLASSR